jgi:membrane-associated phospholipid phosphatase
MTLRSIYRPLYRPLVSAAFLLSASVPRLAAGQSAPPSAPSSHPSGVLITGRDMALIGAATLGSYGLTFFDVRIARTFTDSGFQKRHPDFTTAAKRGSLPTETVLMISSSAIWGIARLSNAPATADVALHTFESIASTAMFIQVVRGAIGRARPYVINDSGGSRDADPHEIQPFHGFTSFNYRSYPSMHAMASFAAATALVQEMRIRHTPNRAVYAPILYTSALVPSFARMYLDEHWASDIAMGIFLGAFSGQKVVDYNHEHPDNWFNRKLLPRSVRIGVARTANGFGLTLMPF